MLYEHFSECPVIEGYSRTVAAYGILGKESNLKANVGLPILLLKQRNDWQWDLPGGASVPEDTMPYDGAAIEGSGDRSIRRTLQRELLEEVGVRSDYHFRIGDPLYEARGSERRIVEHHLFLVVPHGPPKESDEALNLAWVSPKSAVGLKIARFEPERYSLGPIGVMMYDGFSILSTPMYEGALTEEIKSKASSEISPTAYTLIDRSCYFARLSQDGTVKLYRRLNPLAPSGHFIGSLEHLAKQ